MAPSFAELALGSAPKRVTEGHVAALVEADHAAKVLEAERLVREQKRRERIAREKALREAMARGEGVAAAMRKVAGR